MGLKLSSILKILLIAGVLFLALLKFVTIKLNLQIVFSLSWGYLWGSIMGGPLFAKLFHLGDLGKIGSGNMGTTNVLRTGHKTAALSTFVFDALKGFIPILTINLLLKKDFTDIFPFLTAIGVCLGHLYPVWNNFKGGKGIATLAGLNILYSLWLSEPSGWLFTLGLFSLWFITALVTRYSSLAGIVTVLAAIPWAYVTKSPLPLTFYIFIAPLILWRHKDNIQRLLKGTETKIGTKCSPH